MAPIDGLIRDFIFMSIGVFVIFLMYKWLFPNHLSKMRKRFTAWLLSKGMPRVHNYCKNEKQLLFKKLEKHHKQLGFRLNILEVGIGSGINVAHFPPDSCLSCIEPNFENRVYVEQNIKNKAPRIKLEKFVVGFAEDMPDFKDNTFDVVVCTFVLCSVRSQERALKEIRRVLKPGGLFLFLEHVAAPKSSLSRWIQEKLQVIWPYLADGCNLNKETWQQVKNADFSEVDITHFNLRLKLLQFLSSGMFGVAIK